MLEFSGFIYQLKWLSLYSPGELAFVGVIIVVVILVTMILAGPYVYEYARVRWEERAILQKKEILGNLVLMKDIQSELDKEIEDLMLTSLMKKEI